MGLVVGISEYVVSNDPDDVLITYALGSCVGLVLHDPVAGVAGLLHAMMPSSSTNAQKAAETPAMYVDTGTLAMLQAVFDLGATRANLVAKVAGAASPVDKDKMFRIGERNYMVLRKVLWKNGILIDGEDIGGRVSRSVFVTVGTGQTIVKSEGTATEL